MIPSPLSPILFLLFFRFLNITITIGYTFAVILCNGKVYISLVFPKITSVTYKDLVIISCIQMWEILVFIIVTEVEAV